MIELDASLLSTHVNAILMLRGAQLPPLLWHEHPNRAAKSALDAIASDGELLDCASLVDEGISAAVRALLFFWNGWPADAGMYAQLAPEAERTYLEALIKRQAGESAEAKSLFQQIAQHQVYDRLGDYAKIEIGSSVTPELKRLREVIEFAEQWEPFAFGDVFEQAREGQLDPAGERIVRSIQCREFELLLKDCYEAATGKTLEQHRPAAPAIRRPARPARTRRPVDRV